MLPCVRPQRTWRKKCRALRLERNWRWCGTSTQPAVISAPQKGTFRGSEEKLGTWQPRFVLELDTVRATQGLEETKSAKFHFSLYANRAAIKSSWPWITTNAKSLRLVPSATVEKQHQKNLQLDYSTTNYAFNANVGPETPGARRSSTFRTRCNTIYNHIVARLCSTTIRPIFAQDCHRNSEGNCKLFM